MKVKIRVLVRGLKLLYRPLSRRAGRQALQGRRIDAERPELGRWFRDDVDSFVDSTWKRVDELLIDARLEELPTNGNRHNVFLAVVTTAAYQALLDRGVSANYAATLVGDLGWKIYVWMLNVAAFPARITTRDPHERMERTLRALLVFPFSAPGKPGYEVEAWSEGDQFFTHWTHCPPHAFVRQLVEDHGDRGERSIAHGACTTGRQRIYWRATVSAATTHGLTPCPGVIRSATCAGAVTALDASWPKRSRRNPSQRCPSR